MQGQKKRLLESPKQAHIGFSSVPVPIWESSLSSLPSPGACRCIERDTEAFPVVCERDTGSFNKGKMPVSETYSKGSP
jgi:hypothetical protein